MVKPEWGTKRTCPKCATRFYDLTKEDPVTCISCGHAWLPEPVLKSKQPLPFEEASPAAGAVVGEADADLGADLDLDVDADLLHLRLPGSGDGRHGIGVLRDQLDLHAAGVAGIGETLARAGLPRQRLWRYA